MPRHRYEEYLQRVADWWQARPSLSRWLLVLSVSLAALYSVRSGFMGGGSGAPHRHGVLLRGGKVLGDRRFAL